MTTAYMLKVYCLPIAKFPPATRSNGKRNIQLKTKLIGNNAEASRVNFSTL